MSLDGLNIMAIIPCRKGSKGLKNKNISIIRGYPLFFYSVDVAKRSKYIDKILVSTDSLEIKDMANKLGIEVPFLRSDYASSDTAMEYDILIDVNNKLNENQWFNPDIIIWLRPTSPLRKPEDIDLCIEKLVKNKFDSVMGIIESESRLYKIDGETIKPIIPELKDTPMVRRQDIKNKLYRIYYMDIFWFNNIRKYGKNFIGKNIGYHILDKESGIDIDNYNDIIACRSIMNSMDIGNKYFPHLWKS